MALKINSLIPCQVSRSGWQARSFPNSSSRPSCGRTSHWPDSSNLEPPWFTKTDDKLWRATWWALKKSPCYFCSQSSFCSTNEVDIQTSNSVILAAYLFVLNDWIKFLHYFHNPYMSGQVRVYINVIDYNFQRRKTPSHKRRPFQEKGKWVICCLKLQLCCKTAMFKVVQGSKFWDET